jgi:hypothetical protein
VDGKWSKKKEECPRAALLADATNILFTRRGGARRDVRSSRGTAACLLGLGLRLLASGSVLSRLLQGNRSIDDYGSNRTGHRVGHSDASCMRVEPYARAEPCTLSRS